MPRQLRSRRARLKALSADLRAEGYSWADIAQRIQTEESVSPITAFRLARGWTQSQLAGQWNALFPTGDGSGMIADKQISYWEAWPQSGHEPSVRTLKRLARVFECDIGDLVEDGKYRHLDQACPTTRGYSKPSGVILGADSSTESAAQDKTASVRQDGGAGDRGSEKDEMRRRAVLAAAGAAAAEAMLDRPPRVLEAVLTATHGAGSVGAFSTTLMELNAHYAQTVSKTPTVGVYDEMLSLRGHADSLMRAGLAASRRQELAVGAGQLSSLLATVATDLGDHATALVWCADAERQGRESGHPDPLGWAALTRALIAYYIGDAHRSVSHAQRGQLLTPVGTVAHARLVAQEMRARAMLGDVVGMADAERRSRHAMDGLACDVPRTGVFSFPGLADPPYTATSLLLVGRYHEAADATRRVIEAVSGPHMIFDSGRPTTYARSLMILGLAEAGLGRADEAAAMGSAALQCSRPTWSTLVLAGRLDRALLQRRPVSTEAAQYHAQHLDAARQLARSAVRTTVRSTADPVNRRSPHE